MDIYGLRPKGTKINTDDYMTRISHEMENGIYFRAASGSWSPILTCCKVADELHDLDINFKYWDTNDGYGLPRQEQCDKLADALEDVLEDLVKSDIIIDDRFAINNNYWVKDGGGIIPIDIQNKLNEIVGDELFIVPKVEYDGIVYHPHSQTSLKHLTYFIKFLRNCGGFYID